MNEKMNCCNNISDETGSSKWLIVILMREFNYAFNKQQFWESIRITVLLAYSRSIGQLLVWRKLQCPARHNTMVCKKGGFMTLRHNKVKDKIITLFSDVCKDIELEPFLLLSNGEQKAMRKTAKTNDDVRADIYARSFQVGGQRNLRFFDPNAGRYSKQTLKHCYSLNENQEKCQYNTRIMEVDQSSFTSLSFTIVRGMGVEGRVFYSRLVTLF